MPEPITSAVWTGSEMIVWGGSDNPGNLFLTRVGDTTPARIAGQRRAQSTRLLAENYHTVVWAGSEMIVWGGDCC